MGFRRAPRWAVAGAALFILFCLTLVGASLLHISPIPDPTPSPTPDRITANLQHRNTTAALYQIETLAADQGWTPELHQQCGTLYWRVGNIEAAAAHWEAAESTDGTTRERLTQSYLTLNKWPQAVDSLKQMIHHTPENTWARYQLALIQAALDPLAAQEHLQILVNRPEYHEVASLLYAITQDDPGSVSMQMRVGLVLAVHDFWPQAELAFRQAAALDAPYPEALAYIGLARTRQGKEGEIWMQQALVIGVENPLVYYLYGLHLRARADYDASLVAFSQASVLDPTNPAYYAELGQANTLLYNYDMAEYWLSIALAASNNAPEFQELMALFYANTGYRASAGDLALLRQISDYVPSQSPEMLAGFGWTLYTAGDTRSALETLDRALTLDPNAHRASYYKAVILMDIGAVDQASPLLAQLVETDSPFASAAENILTTLHAAEGE